MDLDGSLRDKRAGFYFSDPATEGSTNAFSRESNQLLGFNANKLVEWAGGVTVDVYNAAQDGWDLFDLGAGRAMMGDDLMELYVPLRLLGEFSAGDALKMTLILDPDGIGMPVGGPAQVVMPDLGVTNLVLQVQDPTGDDTGPGTYIYPDDAVFKDSVFDVNLFEVGYDEENLVLTFGFVGLIENLWGSPTGLSVQTMDVYIDVDPQSGTGARKLLPGRNASLMEGYGWDYSIWIEGWGSQVVRADPETSEPKIYSEASSAMRLIVDAAKNTVTVRVPLSFFPEEDPTNWAYAAVVLGQEGYPSQGVWRVRDVAEVAEQYKFGGAPADVNHTRIIDLVLPGDADQDQQTLLSSYLSSQEEIDTLSADDFAQIPMLQHEEN
jgi:hypothetical protein